MPYKEFEPRDTLEEALSKLWGAAQEFVPTTRLEEIICMIANAQPTGIHAVPDIGESDVGKVLTAGEDGAVWASGGGGGGVLKLVDTDGVLDHTWAEIKTALSAGTYTALISDDEAETLQSQAIGAYVESGNNPQYIVSFADGSLMYIASSADGYPVAD